jgi:hypothetical protein
MNQLLLSPIPDISRFQKAIFHPWKRPMSEISSNDNISLNEQTYFHLIASRAPVMPSGIFGMQATS